MKVKQQNNLQQEKKNVNPLTHSGKKKYFL